MSHYTHDQYITKYIENYKLAFEHADTELAEHYMMVAVGALSDGIRMAESCGIDRNLYLMGIESAILRTVKRGRL